MVLPQLDVIFPYHGLIMLCNVLIFSYIVAQVLGAYVACLLIYAQYRDIIKVGPRN